VPDVAAAATLLGTSIGGCRLHRLLEPGAQAALYAGLDELEGHGARAIKLLALAPGASAGERAEAARHFELESRALLRLAHPGVVRCHRAGVQDGIAYLVMELLPGCDMRRYTHPQRLLPPAQVIRIGVEVAQALAHVHSHGVVHRDLKPANVMVDWPTRRVVVTDFGVARLADAQRTTTGVTLGTPAYMAPELLAGGQATAAVDLYALGLLLFELLTGQLPFRAEALGELLRQVAQQPAPNLDERVDGLPPGLGPLIAALLQKSPAARPPDAATVARTLADQCHA